MSYHFFQTQEWAGHYSSSPSLMASCSPTTWQLSWRSSLNKTRQQLRQPSHKLLLQRRQLETHKSHQLRSRTTQPSMDYSIQAWQRQQLHPTKLLRDSFLLLAQQLVYLCLAEQPTSH